jgi:hypothetical protein
MASISGWSGRMLAMLRVHLRESMWKMWTAVGMAAKRRRESEEERKSTGFCWQTTCDRVCMVGAHSVTIRLALNSTF